MASRVISKSSFIRGTKCPKSLWLHFFMPGVRDEISESQQSVFDTGHKVGTLAQQLFPGGIDASRGEFDKIEEAVRYTDELIRSGSEVIYEAAFSDGETLCYMDILAKVDEVWKAYEVKATASVKEYHIKDAAFQYYVITRSGLDIKDVFLVHINNQYVRRGAIEVHRLFRMESLTKKIQALQKNLPDQLLTLARVLQSRSMPLIEMGKHCTSPYNCDFIGFCSSAIPKPPEGTPDPSVRNQEKLDDFKAKLVYPLYFLDFETIFPAVPIHDESRPFQHIPFQYSLHVSYDRNHKESPEHFYFLGTPPEDPRSALIESLISRLGRKGSIIVWNAAFEKKCLSEIARDFPDYARSIAPLFDRIVDLMIPFKKKYFYEPEMNKSYSLKSVLPALVKDLSYFDLEIQEGTSASLAYESMYEDTDPGSVALKRQALLDYCGLDTLSMVRIFELM